MTDAGKQWDHIRSNIDATSGSLILETGNETLERRVAARNVNDPEDRTPEITIKEAVKKAFGAIEENGQLYYTEQATGKRIPIHESAINIVVDERTQNEFKKQLEQTPNKSVYDLTFKRGMNITLHTPIIYDDFESSNGWNYTRHVNGGHTGNKNGMVSPIATAYRQEKLNLKPYTSYTVRAWVKSEAASRQTISVHVDNQAGRGQGLNQELQLEGNGWKLLEIPFNTGSHPEYFSEVAIGNKGNANLHFDDVSITQWMPTEDLVRNHVVSQWNGSTSVDGITFSKVPNTKVRYQLEIDGRLTDIKPASQVDSQGRRSINFKDFNNGNGIYTGSNISVYAVDERNDNLKMKVADHKGQDIVNQLRPSNVSYFHNFYREELNQYGFQMKTGANAPNASYKLINLTRNIINPIHNGAGPNTGISLSFLPSYYPKDEYAVVATVNGMEYVVYKERGENISGDKREGVYLYQHADYNNFGNTSGRSIQLKQSLSTFTNSGMGNDMVSSMRIVGNYEVTLYVDSNFSGRSVTVSNSVQALSTINMNDTVSSIRITDRNRDDYHLVSALNNSSVIDLNQGNNNVTLWSKNNGNNQKWKLVYDVNKSAHQIKNIANENLVLALDSSNGSNNVVAESTQNKEEQYWVVENAGNGYFYLKNKKNSKYLDVTGSNTANGTNIMVYNFTGNNNQKFQFKV
ncbi:hypothetical protein A9498_29550 (plasmid) [Bacillus thuringiensis serovar coreanensis]|nr:hypothetical protein A9498_29550 [Bacillus thuringiensis serovar coreanensis]